MRRVKVQKFERRGNPPRWVRVPNGEGLFHQWGVAFEEFETGPGNYTVAIVERDDGTVETVDAGLVTFLEKAP